MLPEMYLRAKTFLFLMLLVCIPVFNEEESLERIVNEVRAQSLWHESGEREMIIGLNGCTDKSAEISYKLAREDPCIKVLELEMKGKNHALNEMVKISRAKDFENIFFLDADIILEKGVLKKLDNALKRSPPEMAIASATARPFEEKFGRFALHRRYLLEKGMASIQNYVHGRCYAMRRSEAVKVAFPKNQKIFDDAFLTCLYWGRFKVLNSALVRYRVPNYRDWLVQMARRRINIQQLYHGYPELRRPLTRWLVASRQLKMQHAGKSVREKLGGKFPAFIESISGPLIYIKMRSSMRNSNDSWPKIRSTKMKPR